MFGYHKKAIYKYQDKYEGLFMTGWHSLPCLTIVYECSWFGYTWYSIKHYWPQIPKKLHSDFESTRTGINNIFKVHKATAKVNIEDWKHPIVPIKKPIHESDADLYLT